MAAATAEDSGDAGRCAAAPLPLKEPVQSRQEVRAAIRGFQQSSPCRPYSLCEVVRMWNMRQISSVPYREVILCPLFIPMSVAGCSRWDATGYNNLCSASIAGRGFITPVCVATPGEYE